MAKYLFVGDSHWGISNNNQQMIEQNIKVWDYIIDVAQKYNVDAVVEAGDFLDKRKEIDTNLLNIVRENVFDRLEPIGIPLYMIVGNHNLYYKDASTVNNIKFFEGLYNNVHVVDTPQRIKDLDMIPWINKDNEIPIRNFIFETTSKYCIGHFEFDGFNFSRNIVSECQEKIERKMFNLYLKVFSGHYHCSSEKDNVMYIGTPAQLTWIDVDEEKYIYVFDTDTGELVTLVVPYTMFEQFEINEEDWKEYCNDNLKGKKIKIFYDEDLDSNEFNIIQSQFIQINPDIQFIKKTTKKKEKQIVTIDESKTLLDSINEYIDFTEPENASLVKSLINKIYGSSANNVSF